MAIFRDTFTDTDSKDLLLHNPEEGALWQIGPFNFAEMQIMSGKATSIAAATGKGSGYLATSNNYPEHGGYYVETEISQSGFFIFFFFPQYTITPADIIFRYGTDGFYLINFGLVDFTSDQFKLELRINYIDSTNTKTQLHSANWWVLRANYTSTRFSSYKVVAYGYPDVAFYVYAKEYSAKNAAYKHVASGGINISSNTNVISPSFVYASSGNIALSGDLDGYYIASGLTKYKYVGSSGLNFNDSCNARIKGWFGYDYSDGIVIPPFIHTGSNLLLGPGGIGNGYVYDSTSYTPGNAKFDNFIIDEIMGIVGSAGIGFSGASAEYTSSKFNHFCSGGINFSESADVIFQDQIYRASSGVIFNSSATCLRLLPPSRRQTASGGIAFSSTASVYRSFNHNAIGQTTFGGMAGANFSLGSTFYFYTSTGGLILSGTAPYIQPEFFIFYDTFTDSDNTFLLSHGPEFGTGWEYLFQSFTDITIQGNLGLATSASSAGVGYLAGSSYYPDHEGYIISVDHPNPFPSLGTNANFYLIARQSVNGFYALIYTISPSGYSIFSLYSLDQFGIATLLKSSSGVINVSLTRPVNIALRVYGQDAVRIDVYVNDQYGITRNPITYYDSSNLLSTGRAGIAAGQYGVLAGNATGQRFDNVRILQVFGILGAGGIDFSSFAEVKSTAWSYIGNGSINLSEESVSAIIAYGYQPDGLTYFTGESERACSFWQATASGGLNFVGQADYASPFWSYTGSGSFVLESESRIVVRGKYTTTSGINFSGTPILNRYRYTCDPILVLFASMDGNQPVPPTGSIGTGTFDGTFNYLTRRLTWDVEYSGTANPVNLNIRGPAPVGKTASTIVLIGSISGVNSPSIGSTTISNTNGTHIGNGTTYVNLDTEDFSFPNRGELRGQIYAIAGAFILSGNDSNKPVAYSVDYKFNSSGNIRFNSPTLRYKIGYVGLPPTGGLNFGGTSTFVRKTNNYVWDSSGNINFGGIARWGLFYQASGNIDFAGDFILGVTGDSSAQGGFKFESTSDLISNYIWNASSGSVRFGGSADEYHIRDHIYSPNMSTAIIRFSMYVSSAECRLNTRNFIAEGIADYGAFYLSRYESQSDAYISAKNFILTVDSFTNKIKFQGQSDYFKSIPIFYAGSGNIVFSGLAITGLDSIDYTPTGRVLFSGSASSVIITKHFAITSTGGCRFSGNSKSHIVPPGITFSGTAGAYSDVIVREMSFQGEAEFKFNYLASGSGTVIFTALDIIPNQISTRFDMNFDWSIDVPIRIDQTFTWNVGELDPYWYRLEGQCLPTTCYVGDYSFPDHNQTCGCDLISFDLLDSQCGQSVFIMNIIARSVDEICETLKARGFLWPISSIRRFSVPANQVDGGCNILENVEFCNIPECLRYCLALDGIVTTGAIASVEFINNREIGSGLIDFSGSANTFIVPTPLPSSGVVTFAGISDLISSAFNYITSGNILISSNSVFKSTNWQYISIGGINFVGEIDIISPVRSYTSSGGIILNSEAIIKQPMLKFISSGLGTSFPSNAAIVIGSTAVSKINSYRYISNGLINFTGSSISYNNNYNYSSSDGVIVSGKSDIVSSSFNMVSSSGMIFNSGAIYVNQIVAAGGFNLSAISPAFVGYISPITMNVNFGGNAIVKSSNFTHLSSGFVEFNESAEISSSNLGTFTIDSGVFVEVLDIEAKFSETAGRTMVGTSTPVIVGCNCPSISSVLTLSHNLNNKNRLSEFLDRNKYSLPSKLKLNYNAINDIWQQNYHYVGDSFVNNQIERWNVLFDLQCSNSIGNFDYGIYLWKLGINLISSNISTNNKLETRLLVGLPNLQTCINSRLNIVLTINIKNMTITTTSGLDAEVLILYDNLGIFKSNYWKQNPFLKINIAAGVVSEARQTLNAETLILNEPLLT